MATKTEIKRMHQLVELIKKAGGSLNEYDIKRKLELGVSTYNQMKREAKLNPLYNGIITIDSNRGQADKWTYLGDCTI